MHVIGVDIGGTRIKGRVFNGQWETVKEFSVETDAAKGKEAILTALANVLDTLTNSSLAIAGIGIGSAGRINAKTGEVVFATDNLPGWNGFQLKNWVEQQYSIPARVDNDANTALIGEQFLSEHRFEESAVLLTLGTGVGGANYIRGQIVRGAHHQSGEWGHTVLYPGGRPCNCGKNGCIEQYLSGTALLFEAKKQTGRAFSHGKEIFENMEKDDRLKRVVDEFIQNLVLVVGNIATSIDPDRVIVGGGVVESYTYWWEDFLFALREQGITTELARATKLNKAGMYGAAYIALEAWKEGREEHETT